jgi:hypothetical protein
MTAPHARQPQVLPRPACTPAVIRAVLAACADGDFLVYPPVILCLSRSSGSAVSNFRLPRAALCHRARARWSAGRL